MSAVRITLRRTVGYARNVYTTAFVVGAFLATVAARFAFALNDAEGQRLFVSVIWASAVAPVLPVLAAFLGMDSWSEEIRTKRLETLLVAPVAERDFVVGKFLGTWLLLLITLGLSLVAAVALLHVYAPVCATSFVAFGSAYLVLALQGLLWCAVSVACSAFFPRAALSVCATVALLVALPRGLWAGAMAWSAQGRASFGTLPIDAHVVDFASGALSLGTMAAYVLLTIFALFVAVTSVELRRQGGRGSRRARLGAYLSVVLAFVLSVLSVILAMRLDLSFDVPVVGGAEFSDRTLSILSEAHGNMTVTAFLSRSDGSYRSVSRTLRGLSRAAASRGGVRMALRFVDPAWDLGESARLVRAGIQPGSVVFDYGHRRAVLRLAEGFGERPCASAILRLTMPPQRRHVRWTRGHGETAFDDYGAFGMSDIARELSRDGYFNQTIDLASAAQIPPDCALIVVAGAREEFSRTEITRLNAYLKQGGRLLVLTDNEHVGGLGPLLAGWGMGVVPMAGAARTISGTDVIVTGFADHPVTAPLREMRLVLERPVCFTPSAAVDVVGSADRIRFTALATAGASCVAALVEQGAGTGKDLEFRPTRIAVVGDSSFVMNAPLAAQANANADFLLNVVAYLSGTDALMSGGAEKDVLTTGMDRAQWRRFVLAGAGGVPIVVFVVMALIAFRRRRRS